MGLNVDMEQIFRDNMLKTNVIRKNNCIINTGDNPEKEERKRRILMNKKKYGLSQEYISSINLPSFNSKLSKYCNDIDIFD